MKLAHQRPEYYNVEKWGIPINDLDCIATIGTFSATLIWLAFPRQGIWLRKQETIDYIALFRYIGYLTGTPTDYFETPEKARTVMESLLMYEIDPTDTSKILANNVIRALEAQPPQYASRAMLEANSRWLNGNELCDALGLGNPGLYYWALVAGQCIFFMAICYTYRSIPFLDRRKIAVSLHRQSDNKVPRNSQRTRPSAKSSGPSSSTENTACKKRRPLTSNTSRTCTRRPFSKSPKSPAFGSPALNGETFKLCC